MRDFGGDESPYTVQGQIRGFGRLAQGLRYRSRRRRKAFVFLGWWLLASAVLVTAVALTT